MMSSNLPLIQFNPKLPRLSLGEKAILKLLVEAGKLIAPLYQEQEDQAKRSKFTKEEIEKAGERDPDILSPYTVLEKVDGKIIATPYHIKYEKYLKPISEKLNEASKITLSSEFGRFLRLKAKALLDGSYDDAFAAWLKMKPSILDIGIGPFEHLDDKLFFGKATYQAWVGVIDEEGTKRLNDYKSIVLSVRRKGLMPSERVDNLNKVIAKVDDVVLFSGLMARLMFVGVNLPMDVNFVQKYGSEVTLFNQPNDLRMKEQIIPTFNKIFSKAFKEGYTFEDLRRANLRYIAMHELAHSFLYYNHASQNLKDLFQPIFELAATILGLRVSGTLLLKDRITNKQLESMIVASLCRGFHLIEKREDNKFMANYTLGWAIFINFMLESGALKQAGGMAIPNFMKMFISLHDLSNMLEHLLSSGTYKEAQAFVKKYGKLTHFP